MSDTTSKKGVFIPDITVEMFRNASLESIEDLMASGEMEDILLPSAQPEQRWIPCSERLPRPYEQVLRTVKSFGWNCTPHTHADIGTICPIDTDVIAWMPLPEPYREGIE